MVACHHGKTLRIKLNKLGGYMGLKKIDIGNKTIGEGNPTFIIAEVGINHDGDMQSAIELVNQAKNSGADAVKLQTYNTEQRVPKDHAVYDILKKCELSHDHQKELFELGREIGIMVFSTPFDDDSVDFLEEINSPIYKIASFDSVNKRLLEKVGMTKKPVIMSTGMTNSQELGEAWAALGGKDDGSGCELALLHCVSSYPLDDKRANLNMIHHLHSIHDGPVGYSDHTIGAHIPVYAVSAGASVIEKHFTLDTNADGPDHSMSADPSIMSELVKNVRWMEEVLGKKEMKIRDAEQGSVSYRRPS